MASGNGQVFTSEKNRTDEKNQLRGTLKNCRCDIARYEKPLLYTGMKSKNAVKGGFFDLLFSLRPLLGALCVVTVCRLYAAEDIDPEAFLDRPEVLECIRYFTAGEQKTWLESAFARGVIFDEYVSGKIAELSLPETLKYLPVIESGCNPNAVSPSGAAGLWQFMMNSTGPYDLRVNEWIDERRDFWKSTAAGLKKLAYNRAVLGDWLLAVAAYNCGLNRIKRAVEETGSRDFWELAGTDYLPAETKRYVPKLLAVAHIARNAETYEVSLPQRTDWKWLQIPVYGQLNMRLLSTAAGVPAEILDIGNAELKFDVTPPQESPHHLKVPDIYSDAINKSLADMLTVNGYYIHRIKPGDTLYGLSGNYGVPVDLIMKHNPGIEPRFLQINTVVIIPAAGLRESVSTNSPPLHIVEEGDPLWGIAKI